jgi:hypothetical protein
MTKKKNVETLKPPLKPLGELIGDIVEAACVCRDVETAGVAEVWPALEGAVDAYREHLRRIRPWKADLNGEAAK